MLYRYQIDTTITQDFTQVEEAPIHEIFSSKHTDNVFAPSPIQALKKLNFPIMETTDTIEITIHRISEPLGLIPNKRIKKTQQ
jgi:hypothetical protein